MAMISISVPDDYMSTIVAAVREQYPEEVASLTDAESAKHAVKEALKALTERYSLRHADSVAVANADAAVLAAEAAKQDAVSARKDAEVAALADVDTRFKEIG